MLWSRKYMNYSTLYVYSLQPNRPGLGSSSAVSSLVLHISDGSHAEVATTEQQDNSHGPAGRRGGGATHHGGGEHGGGGGGAAPPCGAGSQQGHPGPWERPERSAWVSYPSNQVWAKLTLHLAREERRGEREGFITKFEMEAALAVMRSQIVEEISTEVHALTPLLTGLQGGTFRYK